MNIEERINLIKQVGEKIVKEEELKELLAGDGELVAYDGFEPSGQIHIAQGILRAINVNKMIKAGVKFKMLGADWHAMANNKMGGDLEKIKTVGKYFIEVWRASGMDLSNVEFVWASEMNKDPNYWKLVLQVGKTNALRRFIRTADIFLLGAKITQLGMDQRKLNMLAREVGQRLGFWKPVVVSHHMLMGLGKPASSTADALQKTIEIKMSKSLPDTAIFMTDTKEDIRRKINKAYCLEGDIKENPILEYYRYIIFESLNKLGIK